MPFWWKRGLPFGTERNNLSGEHGRALDFSSDPKFHEALSVYCEEGARDAVFSLVDAQVRKLLSEAIFDFRAARIVCSAGRLSMVASESMGNQDFRSAAQANVSFLLALAGLFEK